eukprot:1188085-Prorocentrum_minimum.AAC.3
MDSVDAARHLAKLVERHPYECVVPCSAASEWALLRLRQKGGVIYQDRGGGAQATPGEAAAERQVADIHSQV